MTHWSLIAYDIREPKRLRRVHAYLRKRAQALQLSVFILEAEESQLNAILADLRKRADNRCDDIRLYAVKNPAAVWSAGNQNARLAGLYTPQSTRGDATGMKRVFQRLFGKDAA
jgi:CRISPR-associated protein Cas2